MAGLTEAQLTRLAGFNQDALDALRAQLGQGIDALSAAGACDITKYVTELTVASTLAFTLAAPTVAGQRKRITCVAATSTPLGTVTISSPDTTTGFVCPATVVFTAVGQTLELIATTGLKWRIVGGMTRRSGIQVLVLGTTLTAGLVMAHTYACSVTNTVDSTGATKALPDGLYPGDKCFITCPTVSGSPVGSLDFTGVTIANTAVTHMQAIGATTDTATLEWNGAAWLAVIATGITLA